MKETYEKGINLKWLIYRALRAWRPIVVWALIIGLVVGIGSAGQKGLKLLDDEFIAEAKLDVERAHASWTAAKEDLQMQLNNLEKAKSRQQEYNEKSILMEIDPLRKHVASFEMYVDYDYQIKPDLTYQPIDLSDRILKSYATYMTNGEMYQYIIENLGYELEMRYLQEILLISIDYDNNMISVIVEHASEAKCQEILNLVQKGIQSRKNTISKAIDTHEMITTNQTAYETIDFDLEDKQESNIQYLATVDISIQEVNEELKEWAQQPEPQFEYELMDIVKGGIKLMIIGGAGTFIGLTLAVVLCAFLSDKLLNPADMKDCFGLRIIGQLPQNRVNKPFAFVSRWFAAFAGITTKPEEYESLAKMIGASIKSDVSSRVEFDCQTIAFTGTAPVEEMEKAVAAMGIKGYTVVCAPNMLTDAATVEKVAEADCVVLVEQQEYTSMIDVEKELEALKAWSKTVLGVVVTNVDAVM